MERGDNKMWMRATRWGVAALIGSAMTAVGCGHSPTNTRAHRTPAGADSSFRQPLVADHSLTYALDTSIEMRVEDRLELDNFLHDRDIRIEVVDGMVIVIGEVWSGWERDRVGALVRSVAGMVDVVNELTVRAPG